MNVAVESWRESLEYQDGLVATAEEQYAAADVGNGNVGRHSDACTVAVDNANAQQDTCAYTAAAQSASKEECAR